VSGNLQSLRHRIDGAGDLECVVRAMKALAASSIGQYERAVASLDDYYRTVELGLSLCLRQAGPTKEAKDDGPVGVVVFGSDQGLVGRFNEAVVDLTIETLRKFPHRIRRLWAVGERANSLLADSWPLPVGLFPVPNSVHGITRLIGRLLIEIESAREKGEVVSVYVFHNHPNPGSTYEAVRKRLLPLDSKWQRKLAAKPWPSQPGPTKPRPEVIGGAAAALKRFIRGYLFMLLFQACAESLNSENASRLAAMQRAEKNINDILEDLNREFNSVRQASIDEELFDVVSGFEALAGRKQ
jgi:F-type H+-transporting ATPase subunit gamma